MRAININSLMTSLVCLLLILSGTILAGGWTDKVPQLPGEWINDIVCRDTSGSVLFVAGDNGYVAFSDNGGFAWTQIPIASTDRIEAVDVSYDFGDTTVFAVGQGGSIFRIRNMGLFDEIAPIAEDIHAVGVMANRVWVAGDNGQILYSDTNGDDWMPGSVNGRIVNFTSLISTPYGMYASAFWNTTTYILSDEDNDTVFDIVDSLQNVIIKSSFTDFGRLYFAGDDLQTGRGAIGIMDDMGGTFGTIAPLSPPEIDAPITDITGTFDTFEKVWVTTTSGKIYSSDPSMASFNPVYSNIEGKSVHSLTVMPAGAPQPVAWAAGSNGLLLRYDFMVMDMSPFMNDFSYPAANSFQIQFTTITDLPSIQNGLFIHSSVQGLVPFTANYFPGDSTRIDLVIQNGGAVPGEIWTIILSNNIQENITFVPFDKTFNYQLFTISGGGQNFLNAAPTGVFSTGVKTSNFVSGFFTEDDIFDFVTISSDSIYLFSGMPGGEPSSALTMPLAIPLSLDLGIPEQIRTMDINLDGMMDLVVYDDKTIQLYIKEPDLSPSIFRAEASYNTNNVQDIGIYSADQDALLDIAILNDSLQSRIQVDEFSFGFPMFTEPGINWENFELRDIDADAFQDFAGLTISGDIILRHYVAWGGFDQESVIPGPFDKFILADIDDDRQMEILAQENSIIRIFHKNIDWQFTEMTAVTQGSPDTITSYVAHDFNNDRFLDVVLTTPGKRFKVFQNIGAAFNERFDVERILQVDATGMIIGDFDMDATLDILAYNSDFGDFQIIRNLPGSNQQQDIANFDSVDVTGSAVFLKWLDFNPIGNLDFYNIYRGPDTTAMNIIDSSFTNTYIDTIVSPGNIYWYRIEAFDISAISYPMTGNLEIIVPYELSGSVSGVLSDTLFPYLVTGPLEVKQDSSLLISEGVKLLFEPDAGLTVVGHLDVMGSEQHFVNFKAKNFGQPWLGITVSGIVNSDTVRFNWFDIEGAIEGMRIVNRPVYLQYAGISRNQTAFYVDFPAGFLKAENIIVQENGVGIQTRNNSKVDLKNVTIVANKMEGIDIYDNSQVTIKNAIIYHNNKDDIFNDFKNGPDIRNQSPIAVNISYSTVDSVEGNYNGFELNPLQPFFQAFFMDSMEFKPDTMSSTIDAGDPSDDFSMEPLPNGGRINQGIYGGTPFAMPTFQPRIDLKIDTLFMTAYPGETLTTDLVIYNTGNRPLEIFNLELHVAEFNYFEQLPVFIPPGDSTVFKMNFLPGQRQVYFDEIFIHCNDPHFPPEGLILPVHGIGLNRPPEIFTLNLLNAVQDQVYIDTVRASDPDADKISFLPIIVPEWMTVSADGGLTGTPLNKHVRQNIIVEILAIDEMGDMDTLLTFIDVLNVNDPPQIITSALVDAIEDSAYADTVFAMDIDLDTLDFYAVNIPGWMKIEQNGAISGIPRNEDVIDGIPVEIGVTDPFGSDDTLKTKIRVINTNDAPVIMNVPDTLAYALLPFNYSASTIDVDGDSLTYSDDTPLFEIDPKTGLINYTPALADTGSYSIVLSVSDGLVSVTDTFSLEVRLTPVLAAPKPQVTPMDKEILLEWKNEFSAFYTATRIIWSTIAPVTDADIAKNFIDTTFALDAPVQVTIQRLKIAKTYYITIFNYFDPGFRIYSEPVKVVATTLAPQVTFDFSDRVEHVPPGNTLFKSLRVNNDGGGTLIFKFHYTADKSMDEWFAADTGLIKVAPGDSANVPYQMFPNKSMEDRPHIVKLRLLTNQPDLPLSEINLTMNILFDHDVPKIIMLSQPDTIHQHRFSALHFNFTANDTVEKFSWRYGTPTEDLRARYKFSRITTTGVIEIKREDNIPLGSVDFYPLPDGLYHFELWVFDPDSNGFLKQGFDQRIIVNASAIPVLKYSWYLASFPREQNIELNEFVADSTALVLRWDNDNMQYVSYTDSILKAGQGFWILSFRARKLDISGLSVSTEDADSVHLTLVKGWNQIGVPSGYHLNLGDLKYLKPGSDIEIPKDEVFSNYLSPSIYWYRSIKLDAGYEWSMIDTTIASPWRGYWIHANQEVTLVYSRIPAFPAYVNIQNSSTADIADANNLAKKTYIANDWQLSFNVANDKHRDAGNVIGISEADAGLPIYEPPHLDDYCSAYFSSEKGNITQDLRKPFTDLREVKKWRFNVSSSSAGKRHTLSWKKWSEESGVYLYLVDQIDEKVINLSEGNVFEFTSSSENHKFLLYATMDANFAPQIIPVSYKLLQNYPNPFNPNTTIKFGIPEEGNNKLVSLKIFNILGQEITTLINKNMKSGYHEVQWNGINRQGLPVASGVYFYRLIGEGIHQVKKMVLIK